MPSLDQATNSFCLRIVYDGASEAGKTTTVRSLAKLLGGEAKTPKQVAGRTTYFDWLEHRGGSFNGSVLQTSLVTVPGQRGLKARRRHLLADADAVVFVLDSTPDGCDAAVKPLRELHRQLGELSPPASFLVQANKRDDPEALPIPEIRERLGLDPRIAITRTKATSGNGVRETYVLAVRLALERLKGLLETGELPELNPSNQDPEILLAELQGLDITAARETLLPGDSSNPGPRRRSQQPRLPDATIPVGHLWPPVAGRSLMAEAGEETPSLEQHPSGSWLAISPGWRYRSDAEAAFRNRDSARRELIEWCRWHTQHQALLTPDRVLSLAADEREQGWRLWQVVREVPPLDLAMRRASEAGEGDRALEILDAAEAWAQAVVASVGAGSLLAYADLSSLTWNGIEVTFREFASPVTATRSPRLEDSDLMRQIERWRRRLGARPTSPEGSRSKRW